MNFTKKFFIAIIAIAALCLLPAIAKAETGNISFGITNASFANSATFTALGASTVSVKNQSSASLVFSGQVISTNAVPGAAIILARVDANGNVETSPRFTWNILLPTGGLPGAPVTNTVYYWTTFPTNFINDATSLSLISIQTTNSGVGAGFLNTPKLTVELKNIRN